MRLKSYEFHRFRVKGFFLLLSLSLILGNKAWAQSGVTDWFPVRTGDAWVYEHETRDQNWGPQLEVHKWETEEIVTGSRKISEGTLVGIRVRVIKGSLPRGWRSFPNRTYLIRGNCLYSDIALDSTGRQLDERSAEGLSLWDSPDFCFPFVVHEKWGAPHGLPDWKVTKPEDAKDWEVVGVRPHDPEAPNKQQTFHVSSISAYPGSGETVDVWFQKGVGIIREDEIHHGTVGERKTRLLRFEPASGKATTADER